MSIPRYYFDNAASTPVEPRVVADMMPNFTDCPGNASSLHSVGREAREAVEVARGRLATCLRAKAHEIYFTSSGTESNNLAIKGATLANRKRGRHVVVSAIEHDCVLNACRWLQSMDYEVGLIPVDGDGLVDPDALLQILRPDTILVSVMHANNEIGTIQPVEQLARICRERNILFHTDACQSFGRVPLDVSAIQPDLVTVNAHKIYGPKGVAALYVREGVRLVPLLHGGGHERGLRSATENVPGIVGFARAAEIAMEEWATESRRLSRLRDRIVYEVFEGFPNAYLNGHLSLRLPGHINLGFQGLEGEAIRLLLELSALGIAVSSGSACSSNDSENKPSHVLTAIGKNPVEARGALRISLGRFNTKEEVDHLLQSLFQTLGALKGIAFI